MYFPNSNLTASLVINGLVSLVNYEFYKIILFCFTTFKYKIGFYEETRAIREEKSTFYDSEQQKNYKTSLSKAAENGTNFNFYLTFIRFDIICI